MNSPPQVIWRRLYKSCLTVDGGSLFQLRNVINRRNVVSDVSKDLTACEEFLELVVVGHVLAAAVQNVGVANTRQLSDKILSSADPIAAVRSIVETLCSQAVCVSFTKQSKKASGQNDNVLEYARETLSLGLLLLEFKDAIKGGDGTRVLRCWKYFLIIFRATGHKNYCIEAFIFLMQYYYTLPPRHAEQMLKKKTFQRISVWSI